MRRPRRLVTVALGAVLLAAVVVPFLGEDFLPRFMERDFLMHWVEKPGASLEASRRITLAASRELRQVPGVRNFGAHTGRAEVADEVVVELEGLVERRADRVVLTPAGRLLANEVAIRLT